MTRTTVRKKASAKGHVLGNFVKRYSSGLYGERRLLYSVAWCSKCDASAFTSTDSGVNPALDNDCPVKI